MEPQCVYCKTKIKDHIARGYRTVSIAICNNSCCNWFCHDICTRDFILERQGLERIDVTYGTTRLLMDDEFIEIGKYMKTLDTSPPRCNCGGTIVGIKNTLYINGGLAVAELFEDYQTNQADWMASWERKVKNVTSKYIEKLVWRCLPETSVKVANRWRPRTLRQHTKICIENHQWRVAGVYYAKYPDDLQYYTTGKAKLERAKMLLAGN